MSAQNVVALTEVNQALENEVSLSSGQQMALCETFSNRNVHALKNKFIEYGTTLEDSYSQVHCVDGNGDLLKYRVMNSTVRSDLAAFILYYKRDLERESDLPKIFNTVVPGPGNPKGTLLDFIEHYSNREGIDPIAKQEYLRMMTLLRAHGAKKASEL